MSLLDVWVTPAEAIMAVDTDGVSQDGQRMPSSKLLHIPHLNAALGLRGQAAALKLVFLQALGCETFDELAGALPSLLQIADMTIPEEVLVQGTKAGNELVAAGWSARAQRMVAWQYVRNAAGEYQGREVDHHISPAGEWLNGVRLSPQAVGDIARRQVDWMQRTFPNAACGGSLLVASVTRTGMMLRRFEVFENMEVAA